MLASTANYSSALKVGVAVGVEGPRASGDDPDREEGQVQRRQWPVGLVEAETVRRRVHLRRTLMPTGAGDGDDDDGYKRVFPAPA